MARSKDFGVRYSSKSVWFTKSLKISGKLQSSRDASSREINKLVVAAFFCYVLWCLKHMHTGVLAMSKSPFFFSIPESSHYQHVNSKSHTKWALIFILSSSLWKETSCSTCSDHRKAWERSKRLKSFWCTLYYCISAILMAYACHTDFQSLL